MSFLTWIRGWVEKKPVSALEEQRTNLICAIQRCEEQLDQMHADAADQDVCPCCVGAFYGGTEGAYDKLYRKLERQYAWLEILNGKLAK